MQELIVTKVLLNQIEDLQIISRHTFAETFAEYNSTVNMANYLEKDLSVQQLTSEFNNPESVFYFVLLNENVIGYLKLNLLNADEMQLTLKGMEIARIYVLNRHHGDGAGQLLFNTAISIAEETHCDYIWLGVWEKNARAIRFYEKNSFEIIGNKKFILGEDVQNDFLMFKRL